MYRCGFEGDWPDDTTDIPKTVDEAATQLLDWFSDEEFEQFRDGASFGGHFGLGGTVRYEFNLWGQNNWLVVDALGYEGHPDCASGVIIDRARELAQEDDR